MPAGATAITLAALLSTPNANQWMDPADVEAHPAAGQLRSLRSGLRTWRGV